MSDGSLRITFEFEPRHAASAFALFGPRGRAVAIAALADGSVLERPAEPEPAQREPIGDACYRAVQWCKDPEFWEWIRYTSDGRGFGSCTTESSAKLFIQETCGVQSRKELDTDNEANKAWHREIREPYRLWLLGHPT